MSESERQEVIKIACSDRHRDQPPNEIVPALADEGFYIASESTFYRVLRQENMITRKEKKSSRHIPVELKAEKPNRLWSWDITYLRTEIRGKFYYLYMFMDVWSRPIMGWEIHETEDKELSALMMERLYREHRLDKDKLILHADNGGPMKNATMLSVLQKLGVAESFSRPNVSNDNAYSESLFRTLKYRAGYPARFESIEKAREWVERFVRWYNYEHRHSGIGYVTPMERHSGKDIEIFARRNDVYKAAKLKHPERWSRDCKTWKRTDVVYLKKGNRKKVA